MNADARKEYLKAITAVSNLSMNISESIGCIEFFREKDTPPAWDSVGTMNSIVEKLKTVLDELENYERVVTEDGEDRVRDRRERREKYHRNTN